ncbi:MAG: hypothetical protein IKG27_01625 [Bacilli bacterium]|nr:hypothetical protein [Bacilli bacterium]
MNNISFISVNEQKMIRISKDFSKYMDSLLDKRWAGFDFEKMCGDDDYTITDQATFLDYLSRLFDYIKITIEDINMDTFSYKFSNIINDFDNINFVITDVLGPRDGIYLQRKVSALNSYFIKCVSDEAAFKLEELIKLLDNFFSFQLEVRKLNDMIFFKDDLLKDLSDVIGVDQIHKYRNKYDVILNDTPINVKELEKLFRTIQKIILDDFKNRLTDPYDYKRGEPFKFLCHSTYSLDWEGEYWGNYISTSLLTSEHNSPFRLPFGFVMNPEDIVMTCYEDLHVSNKGDKEENLRIKNVMPIVQSMDHVIRDTYRYNEVLIKGFDPIGIFCVTDGSKELNPFYLKALELKEQFPELPIVDLDMTLYDSFEDSVTARNELVDVMREEFKIFDPVDESYYASFEPFWQSFLELKKSGNYTITDIFSLFTYYNGIIQDPDKTKKR